MTDPYFARSQTACPSAAWEEEPYDDTICFHCQTKLPEEDPGLPGDPTQDSWWQDGFCSADCLLTDIERLGVQWDPEREVWDQPGVTGLDKDTLEKHRS